MTAAVDLCSSPPEFTVNRRALAAALARVRRALGRAPPTTHDVVRIDADAGRVMLTAAGTDVAIQASLPAAVLHAGSMDHRATRLVDLVRSGRGSVTVQGLRLVLDHAHIDLPGLGAGCLPALPPMPRVPIAQFAITDFSRVISRTCYAMSSDASRPHLCGALLAREAGIVRVVATDGHRLAAAGTPAPGRDFTALVHRRGVECVVPLLASSGGSVRIHVADERVWFVTDAGWVSAPRVTEASFPAWEQVIPANYTARVTVPRGELLGALRAIAPRPDTAVRLEPAAVDDHLVLRTDGGCATVPAVREGGLPRAVGVRAQYLRELFDALDDDYGVTLEFGGELDPIKVQAPWHTVSVVMPMRL